MLIGGLMELKEKYIYRIYQEKSISKAAKKLFISQPALSAALSKHEKELGFKIFDRSSPLTLTPKGRIYIEHLLEIIESEKQMKQKLVQITSSSANYLSIGGYLHVNYHLFPLICKELNRKFPDTVISIDIGNTRTKEFLHEKLADHTIDILLSHKPVASFKCIPLIEEDFFIVMHKKTAEENNISHKALTREQIINKSYTEDDKISDFTPFKNIKFMFNYDL